MKEQDQRFYIMGGLCPYCQMGKGHGPDCPIANLEAQLAAEKAARKSEHGCELWRQQCDAETRTRQEEQLAAEREKNTKFATRLCNYGIEMTRLKEERDEWAAHCERLRYAFQLLWKATSGSDQCECLETDNMCSYCKECLAAKSILGETPRASLAHIKAQARERL